ncbi:DUF2125 domain-containing protein [Anianabacter salinae]|uniref:DUF2125 domain-containing protein n=1 Tax=Anianabacter salinae TaxID=2851023 RepID=UPI00225DF593|nr:DUF2125 domain-containing protein [Anianabacter salinae]MBV0912612.1 DUF2125 domain-containing protein [Anianabacter salinae]
MRKLIWVLLALAALWGGYWFIGSTAVERGIAGWLDARAAEGWVAEYDDVTTRGFPNRFDTTVTGIRLADPATGVAWTAPFFQMLALSYKPNHIIAVWPNEQSVASPFEKVAVTSDDMRGSVIFEAGTALTLDHATFVLDNIALSSDAGWQASATSARLATRQTAALQNSHDIGFEADTVTLTEGFRASVDPAGVLPDAVQRMRIDATVGFDAPWNRFAIEDRRPQVTRIELREMQARWGEMDLRLAGELDVDAAGVPTGKITVRAENWRQMFDMARAAGLIPDMLAPTAERGLAALAGMSGQPETLDAPLTFRNGIVAFGPIPIGQAPNLTIR